MKYIIVKGGLGNQMFQYAIYLQLLKMGEKVTLDLSPFLETKIHNGFELKKIFTLDGHTPRIIQSKLFNYIHKIIAYGGTPGKRHGFIFFEGAMRNGIYLDVFKTKAPVIEGYFQSEQYFLDAKEEVRKSFTFSNIDQNNMEFANKMRSCNSVSIHIRRGDYAAYGMKIIGFDYYHKAISHILTFVKDPHFFIFSDDIAEAEKICKDCNIDCTLISHNMGADSYKDMYLMSNCKHNIIANSSFSWWGAWLNANPQKIVVSPLWGKFFHCSDWIVIE